MVNNSNAETLLCQAMIIRTVTKKVSVFFKSEKAGYRERGNYENADNCDCDCGSWNLWCV